MLRSCLLGGLSGSIGACVGSPFFLIKTQMQSFAMENIAVGFQRKHDGLWSALRSIYTKNGFQGLYRNFSANIPRSFLASGAQLATFEPVKDFMRRHNFSFGNPTLDSLFVATIASTSCSIAITPPDIVLTRLFNQPTDDTGRGKYYNGAIDCACKLIKFEGISALYKGFFPIFFRVTPHSTIVLFLFDKGKMYRNKYFSTKNYQKIVFLATITVTSLNAFIFTLTF